MEDIELTELLQKTADSETGYKDKPKDQNPGAMIGREADIPDEELTERIMYEFKNEVLDKDESGWRANAIKEDEAYYEIKDEFFSNHPYPNSANYPVSMTQVFVDTMNATINDLKWRNHSKVVSVSPVNDEDVRSANNVESLLNFVDVNMITDYEMEDDASDFYMIKNGTGFLKMINETEKGNFKIGAYNVKPENIYMPRDSKSPKIADSSSITQIIALNANDMRDRIANGQYRNLDKVGKMYTPSGMSAEQLERIRKEISGIDNLQNSKRDLFYIAERYMTYYPKGSLRPVELIVWFAPMNGAILRKVVNTEKLRPFVDKYIYPNHGQPFHRSLYSKIRHLQDKANYADKQKTDGIDKAVHRAGFYEGTSGFDPRLSLRVPLGMYKVKNLGTIQWEPVDVNAIMLNRQELADLWLLAERVTGLTDLQQGIVSRNTAPTLGQDVMRSQRSDIRFSKIAKNVNRNWKMQNEITYRYCDLYMPRQTKVKILGTNEYAQIEKLFPIEVPEGEMAPEKGLGIKGNFDYRISNKPIQQEEQDNEKRSVLMGEIINDPVFGEDVANRYRAYIERAEANGIIDFENVVTRPPQANIPTPDDVIDRLANGEVLNPDAEMNPIQYINPIKNYMRTGNFKDSDITIQKNFARYLLVLEGMRKAQVEAFKRFSLINSLNEPSGAGQPMNPNPPVPGAPAPQFPQGGAQ